jgi:hypothetical protein
MKNGLKNWRPSYLMNFGRVNSMISRQQSTTIKNSMEKPSVNGAVYLFIMAVDLKEESIRRVNRPGVK